MLRLGDGAAALTAAATVGALDLYDLTTGTVVNTIHLPVAVSGTQKALTFAGNSTSEGALTLSADGHYVTFAGYNADTTVTAVSSTAPATVNRVIGRVDAAAMLDTSTAISATTATGNPRSAVTTDGSVYYFSSSSGGVHVVDSTHATGAQVLSAPTNMRWLGIAGGNLYGDSNSGTSIGWFQIGTGLPTTPAITTAPTVLAAAPAPYGFALLDLDATVAGYDTLYIANDSATAGIQKWKFNGTAWAVASTFLPPAPTGSTATAVGVRGLTAIVNAGVVTLVGTTNETTGIRLFSVVDDGSATPTFNFIATAATNTAFRGVCVAPQ